MSPTPATVQLRLLADDPPVVVTVAEGRRAPIGAVPAIAAAFGRQPAHHLLQLFGQFETPSRHEALIAAWRDHMAAAPHHPVTVLANTMREVRALQRGGVPVVPCNHNAFIDERVFDVDPAVEKVFDAIYVGRFSAEKRHHLAAKVSRLALVSGHVAPADLADAARIRAMLPDAVWANAEVARRHEPAEGRAGRVARILIDRIGHVGLPSSATARWMNRARVGLCLSAVEGAMRASMEYLLCGLPVVSTRNIGGRDRYREAGHWREVADDPEAVAAAVADFVAKPPDPQAVRTAALAKVRHDRAGFVDLVQAIVEEGGGTIDFAARLPRLLEGGLLRRVAGSDLAQTLALR